MKKLDFSTTIEEIMENKIILPDFQRGFAWKDFTRQRALLASVLTKLPLGTVLLLESKPDEYGCRKIGQKGKLNKDDIPTDKPYVLLDGQQRMTTLTSFLSDFLKGSDELISPTLARRYFYRIPRFSIENLDNIFGVARLKACEGIQRFEYPDFATNDIVGRIVMKKPDSRNSIIYQDMKQVNKGDFTAYCTNKEEHDGYLIPLFLLYGACQNRVIEHSSLLKMVLKEIAVRYIEDIEAELKITSDELYNKYVKYLYEDEDKNKENTGTNMVHDELVERLDDWTEIIRRYLESCVKEMEIHEYRLEGKQERMRAIDIYENMNKGGKALDVFDLLLAKAAQNPQEESLRETVENYIKKNHREEYNVFLNTVNQDIINSFNKEVGAEAEYSASFDMRCWDTKENELVPAYSKILVDLIGVLSHFMDERGELCLEDKDRVFSFTIRCVKREYLLDEISSDKLWTLTTLACNAIDRALIFLKTRCGVVSINDVHYNLMLVIIATILSNDKWYNNQIKTNLLEAWYWAIIFSGQFRVEQNKAFENHLKKLLDSFIDDKNEYIVDIAKDMFNDSKFLTKEILTFSGNNQVEPQEFMRDIICQYYLSRTYIDILKPTNGSATIRLSTFCERASQLHKHHIMPIGELASKYSNVEKEMKSNISDVNQRNDKYNKYNSPLNFALILPESNRTILNSSLAEYIQYCDSNALQDLNVPTEILRNENIDKVGTKLDDFLDERCKKFFGNITGRMRTLLNEDGFVLNVESLGAIN